MTKSSEQRRGNLRQSVSLRLGDQEDSANSRAGEHHRSRSSGEEVILFETPSAWDSRGTSGKRVQWVRARWGMEKKWEQDSDAGLSSLSVWHLKLWEPCAGVKRGGRRWRWGWEAEGDEPERGGAAEPQRPEGTTVPRSCCKRWPPGSWARKRPRQRSLGGVSCGPLGALEAEREGGNGRCDGDGRVPARSAAQSCLTLCDPVERAAARQAPLSMGFPRQEYCSEVPLPSPDRCVDSVCTSFRDSWKKVEAISGMIPETPGTPDLLKAGFSKIPTLFSLHQLSMPFFFFFEVSF